MLNILVKLSNFKFMQTENNTKFNTYNFNLSDFKLIRKLGLLNKRKFNDVYLVQNKVTNELNVLKYLKKSATNNFVFNMLRFEAGLSFNNTNLPKTILIHETETEISIIKNYFEGIPLNEFWKMIKKKDQLNFIVTFLKKIEPLFNELKSKNLIHGDIKPSNIIINKNNIDFDVYLIDFGLSFYPNQIERKIIFSLGFSAPELIVNKLNLATHSTDIFSLGICVWQLFENKIPLTNSNPAIMTNLQLTHPLPYCSKLNKEWNTILQKMCYKSKFNKTPNLLSNLEIDEIIIDGLNQRYQSISEIIVSLEKIKPKINFLNKLWLSIFVRK